MGQYQGKTNKGVDEDQPGDAKAGGTGDDSVSDPTAIPGASEPEVQPPVFGSPLDSKQTVEVADKNVAFSMGTYLHSLAAVIISSTAME